ncbi:Kinesin motor domain [Trypanosoma melophagium]|uniref:Kinesin motor domain n=1 Tax=Trypanosoma melophagium TaxID=715481 RepID=UPI003519E1BE|nr:Kinesin motor domain [Trypanosoma melophagium]
MIETNATSPGAGARVQVSVRICPPREGEKVILQGDPDDQQAVVIDHGESRAANVFKFDRVFTGPQDELYNEIGRPMLKEAFGGFNVCLFAYGQTGSGKTHSLFWGPEQQGELWHSSAFCTRDDRRGTTTCGGR